MQHFGDLGFKGILKLSQIYQCFKLDVSIAIKRDTHGWLQGACFEILNHEENDVVSENRKTTPESMEILIHRDELEVYAIRVYYL